MTVGEMQVEFTERLSVTGGPAKINTDRMFRLFTQAQDLIIEEYYQDFERTQEITDALRPLVITTAGVATVSGLNQGTVDFFSDKIVFPDDYWHLLSFRCLVWYSRLVNIYGSAAVPDLPTGPVIIIGPDTGVDTSDKEDTTKEDKGFMDDTDFLTGSNDLVSEGKRNPINESICFKGTFSGHLVQQDDIFRILQDPFNTTRYDNPVATISGNNLIVFTNKRFIVDNVLLNYLKRPAAITLSQGPTLPDPLHKSIVDRAVTLHLSRQSAPATVAAGDTDSN